MKEKYHYSERGCVYYQISDELDGNKITLVFLHGLTADHTLFDKQTDYFKDKYNIIVWDAPMHAKSRPYINFTYSNAAANLKDIIDENNIPSCVMIGQSMGGYIIQSFLQRYPKYVRAFIAIDTCPYGEVYYSKSDKWWLRQIEWMSRLYPINTLKKAIAKQTTTNEYSYNNMLNALEGYEKRELCHLMGIGFAGFLDDNKDMTINCPTLLLVGRKIKRVR